MKNIWFTSDLHFRHKNLLNLCRDTRRGETTEEHDELLIESLNSVVRDDHILYILGDLSMNASLSQLMETLDRIRGHKRIIWGNHDPSIAKNLIAFRRKFEVVEQMQMIRLNENLFHLCHFPISDWWNMHRGSYMLHGHTHGRLSLVDQTYRIFDVGIDNRNDDLMLPHHIDDIVDVILKDRELFSY